MAISRCGRSCLAVHLRCQQHERFHRRRPLAGGPEFVEAHAEDGGRNLQQRCSGKA